MDVHGRISVKLHLRTLKFKFQMIFTHHEILFFLSLTVSHLQRAETTLGSQIIQKQRGGWIWPMGHSWAVPERGKFCSLSISRSRWGYQALAVWPQQTRASWSGKWVV